MRVIIQLTDRETGDVFYLQHAAQITDALARADVMDRDDAHRSIAMAERHVWFKRYKAELLPASVKEDAG